MRLSKVTMAVAGIGLVAGALDAPADDKVAVKPPGEVGVYAFEVDDIDGQPVQLSQYKGDVLLIVNVASECGLTQQNYEKLEPLYQKYKDQGFQVLAFPANNFGAQEPGTEAQIKEFCSQYKVTFPLFSKVSVTGDDKCPLYKYLTEETGEGIAGEVTWNFQKYVVGRDGKVLKVFNPRVAPDNAKLNGAIEKALAAPKPDQAGEVKVH